MKRRAALAASLGLTIIVGFAIAALGKETGLFGSSSSDGAAPQVGAEAPLAPTLAPPTAVPTLTPIVIERVVYRDEYVPGQSDGGETSSSSPRRTSPPPPAATTGSGATAPAPNTPQAGDDGPPPVDDGFQSAHAEFEGQVVAASGNNYTIADEHGEVSVTVTPDTRVHGGALAVGVEVNVHAQSIPGGVWIANEVEVDGGVDD